MTFLYNLCPCKLNKDNKNLSINEKVIIKKSKLESNQTKSLIPIYLRGQMCELSLETSEYCKVTQTDYPWGLR